MYSDDQLKQFLFEFRQLPGETEWLEFKEAKNSFDTDDLGRYFSAISNEANLKKKHCGWLIFGVVDRLPRTIVGSNYRNNRAALDKIKQDIAQGSGGIGFQEIYELSLPEGRVLMFQVPAAPAGMPTAWKGHFYGRNGESQTPLSIHKLEVIRRQAGSLDWTAEICPKATLNDLDEQAVNSAIDRFVKKHQGARFSNELKIQDKENLLEKAKLLRGGKITRATILLLGKPESAHYVNPHPAQISWRLNTEEEEAYEHFGPPFLLTVEDVFRRIRNVKLRFQTSHQLIPIELTKYDPVIILEALNNCIAHQDYWGNARIIISEYADRLILQNAGGFFEGKVEDYVLENRTPEHYRNLFLVQAMLNLDMIDTVGMGIRRMFQEQRKRYFPLPEYDVSDSNKVKLTIYGKILDENYSNVLFERADLSLSQVMALDRIQKKEKVDAAVVKELRKMGLIEGRIPKLYVSANIAAATENKAQYIKNRAFDDSYYEKLIVEFIEKYGFAARKDIDRLILAKLPEILGEKEKTNKVGNILSRMRRQRIIINIGTSRKPHWVKQERSNS